MYIQSDWYYIIWLKLRIKPNKENVLKLITIISNIFSDILSVKSHLDFYHDDV